MPMAEKGSGRKMICQNKRARFDYEIGDLYEAGLVLQGTEVKSLRQGRVSLQDAYADMQQGELYLLNAHIDPYDQGNRNNHDPERPRKLLLHKQEIKRLAGKIQERGLTLVPTRLYFTDGKAKVEIGLGKGKKHYDKRQDMKTRTAQREIERELRSH
jgi:SsrA-binding protein